MPVYVDPLISWPSKAKTPRCFKDKPSCHMYADTPAELHALAARIGMKREWFQNHRVVGHYDLTPAKRALAVEFGAIEQNREEAVAKWRALREGTEVASGR